MELSRSNLHEFQRYITECGDSATAPAVDFITYIRKRNLSSKPQVYSIDYLHAYCKQFVDVMKNVPGVRICNCLKIVLNIHKTMIIQGLCMFISRLNETRIV